MHIFSRIRHYVLLCIRYNALVVIISESFIRFTEKLVLSTPLINKGGADSFT